MPATRCPDCAHLEPRTLRALPCGRRVPGWLSSVAAPWLLFTIGGLHHCYAVPAPCHRAVPRLECTTSRHAERAKLLPGQCRVQCVRPWLFSPAGFHLQRMPSG